MQTEFGTTFFVEAAAGTGKTTALVGRIVGMVRAGTGALAQTVAVTFTEKAAGEMKLRLRLEIEQTRTGAAPDERARLDRALEELELARIGTMHAFCGDLLSERPVEAGVDPLFSVAAEGEAASLADEAFERWLQGMLADPPEGPRRILRRRSGWDPPQQQLRDAMHTLCQHRDFPGPWRRDPFDRNGAIDALIVELAEVGRLASTSSWPGDPLARNLSEIALFVREATQLEAVAGRDYDGLEAELRELGRDRRRFRGWEWKGSPKTTFGALSRDDVVARRDRVRANLAAFIEASDADLAPLVHEALRTAIADYELLKVKAGRLDFLDLLIKARDLVRDHADVREDLQKRFTHFFVDEFQDTDPLQAEILLLLAADDPREINWRAARPIPGKLFLVGDPKQSIYRFRRADVALYEEVKKHLLSTGAELLHLTKSFRAPPSIQRFVNDAFAPAMTADADAGEAAYVPLQEARAEISGRPTIIALPVPEPYSNFGRIADWRINDSLPVAVGAFVDWLITASGWTVEEDGEAVPIRPRHIALLFRRFRSFRTDITRPYIRALEARRIPHLLVGGRSFYDREEVLALRNALTAIEWPEDELKVFATLRGPLFALSDEALLAYRQRVGSDNTLTWRHLNPMHPADRATLSGASVEVVDALDVLRRLHLGRNHRPIAQTITMLLQSVRAHAGIALWPNGEQALANCQRLIDMARSFERDASSFRGFVEHIEEQAEHGHADEAPIVEEGTEGVRVMTVYKAKGLEFPIVILADPTYNASRDTPSRHVDAARHLWVEPLCGAAPIELREASSLELRRDQAEAIRVAYVAATRASDLLIAPVCSDEPIDGWFKVLNPLLYPADDARRTSAPAPGCPAFGEDSVLSRGPKGKMPAARPVRPGLHAPENGGAPVVWWDPAILTLEVEELAPLRHQRLLEADPDGAAAQASEQQYAAWKAERAALRASASRPSLSVETVTAFARKNTALADESTVEGTTSAEEPVEIERLPRGEVKRPGGRRFGALVHAMLGSIDLDASPDAIQAAASIQGRLVAATEEEKRAAEATVGIVLAHSILRRAAAAAHNRGLRRETPIILRLDDGCLVEGAVDLAFNEAAGWTVVDFKTDREFQESSNRYVQQVRVYARAVAAATGSPTRGVLLVI